MLIFSCCSSNVLNLHFKFFPKISVNHLRALIVHGLSLLFAFSYAQGWMMERTSLERCWWASMSESGNESLRQMKTTCPRCRRWRNSLLARSRWVSLSLLSSTLLSKVPSLQERPSLSIMLWTYIDPGSRNDSLSIPVMVRGCEMIRSLWLNMFLPSPIVCLYAFATLCVVVL